MAHFKLKKGLDIPITGKPDQVVGEGNLAKKVALLGDDYPAMKPTMAVSEGDKVKLGQVLFSDKKMPAIKYTSPGAGTVIAINRGEKRRFISVIIELSGNDEITFDSCSDSQLESLKKEKITDQLLESGLWTSFRTRPFSKVADPGATPHSIFVNAMDTNPLAPSIVKVLEVNKQNFTRGLKVIAKLTEGKTYLCKSAGDNIPDEKIQSLSVEEFSGPHPSGNSGTHIHFLDPASKNKTVWYINAEDVVSIGALFVSGKLDVERIVSLSGPAVKNPRLIRSRMGASIDDVVKGELKEGVHRVISGSILSGNRASGTTAFIGRYHRQISVIEEDKEKKFLGWLDPGLNLFSSKRILLSSLFPDKKFNFTTALNGAKRAIVPIGSYESVMPLDILPTALLRSLVIDDVEEAEALGCLELDEEDLALCTFVSPSKIDYGPILRRNLMLIEKEG